MVERRFLQRTIDIRADGGATEATGRLVRGYAAVFDSRSEVLHDRHGREFVEMLKPGAFDGADLTLVHALWSHRESEILARRLNGRGTLSLGVDKTGLWYEFVAPNTTTGNDLLELLRRGDVDRSSFAFVVAKDGDGIEQLKDGTRLRTIRKIAQVLDVSVVGRPAYPAASAAVRGTLTPHVAGAFPIYTSHSPSRPWIVPSTVERIR